MGRFITQESIEAVKSAADIVTVAGEYVRLEKKGSDYWGLCPFHADKNASFHVIPEKNAYYCFACHTGGSSSVKFVQDIEKVSFPEAVTLLANRFGVKLQFTEGFSSEKQEYDDSRQKTIELYDRVSTTFHYFLTQDKCGAFALNYIKGRGVSDETIEKFRLGYSPADRKWLKNFLHKKNFSDEFLSKTGLFSQNYPDISFFSDRLMFPIFDRRGQCVAMGGRILHPQSEKDSKYLNSRELPHYSKKNILYAFNFAKEKMRLEKAAVICEGYMDCIAYHQCGITNAVATCGTALTEEHVKLIARTTENGTVYLSFDSDGAGQAATKKSILLCRKLGLTVRIVRLTGGKDPAEIMVKYGADTLTNDVKNAILDSDYLFENLTHEYPVDTPEGKSKAALAFFPYVDALQTDIQKESSLEMLCQKLNVSRQSVLKDYTNRTEAERKFQDKPALNKKETAGSLKKSQELQLLLAVMADTGLFEFVQRELSEEVFETSQARQLFNLMEECFQKGELSFSSICEKCPDEPLVNLITTSVISGEYSANTKKFIEDSIRLIKRKELSRQRDYIVQRLKNLGDSVSPEVQKEKDQLLTEKMNIDRSLLSK